MPQLIEGTDQYQDLSDELKRIFKLFLEKYHLLSPEQQVLHSTISSYMYLKLLLYPESFSEDYQPYIDIINKIPLSNFTLWFATAAVLVGSVDGLRRIIVERLPFYKAYIQVFLLSKFDD